MNATQQRLHRQQPALVVKHGNAENKTLELDHDGLTLGRARGCDIELNAPEVSTIHCIISRTATGLYIRDCKSRAGTRLNGQRIYEAPLHDGDVLQIGPFSFEVQVPGVYLLAPARSSPEAAGQSRAAHLARSRRHLAELALGLRERLRAREAAAREQETSQSLNLRRVELDRQAEALRVRIRDFEQKFLQVEDAERHLAAARESMVRDQSAFRTHVQQVEQELEQRRIQAEVEIQKRRQELEDWYKEVEQGGVSLEHTSPDGLLFSEELQELERRRQELDRYAQHLLETEQRLQEQTETWQREKAQAQGKTPAPADETSSPPKPSLPPEENLEGLCADL
ncbi:MAG: FHA domain-containing protein, partial [Planctomycetes bacterium]|nr:FHA domain-containing protein [Planctomycetota bacterium]